MSMKKRKDPNQPVTTGEFQRFIGDFHDFANFVTNTVVTKDDLKGELKAFATKKELGLMAIKLEAKIEKTEERLEEKITEFKSEILNHVDTAMGEQATIRQEQTMDAGHHHRTDQKLEGHEKRIQRLEVRVGVA